MSKLCGTRERGKCGLNNLLRRLYLRDQAAIQPAVSQLIWEKEEREQELDGLRSQLVQDLVSISRRVDEDSGTSVFIMGVGGWPVGRG